METIKYKRSVGNYVKKIEVATGKVMSEFRTDQPRYQGYINEMNQWLAISGNEIEPFGTQEEIAAREAKEEEYEKVKYRDLRRCEYPPIPDQLDYIYWNGIDAWKADMIEPVKKKYPKPSQ
jgi:hypothetical protein